MSTTELLLIILAISTLNVVCFFVGARVGQKVSNNEKLEIPNPVKAIIETKEAYEESKESKAKIELYNQAMKEINEYDGY